MKVTYMRAFKGIINLLSTSSKHVSAFTPLDDFESNASRKVRVMVSKHERMEVDRRDAHQIRMLYYHFHFMGKRPDQICQRW